KEKHQKYNLEKMRNGSADRILKISATIDGIAASPENATKSIKSLQTFMGDHKILSDNANEALNLALGVTTGAEQVIKESDIVSKLKDNGTGFRSTAAMVRSAKTLQQRVAAHLQIEKNKKDLLLTIK